MFDIDKYMNKPFFGCTGPDFPSPPGSPPMGAPVEPHRCPPRYTMTEEVEHTARLMRETIDRLLKFEQRVKTEVTDLSKNLTADNVIFKNAVHEAWTTFLMEVKNEINVFEGNVEADIRLFKTEIETNYATLSEDVRNQIAENLAIFEQKVSDFENKYEQEFSELRTSIQEQYNAFVEAVNSRIDLHNENCAQAFADYQRHLNTELNTFEQTMNTNYQTFTESVGNSIHEFKTHWEQVITERLAAQDAKVSDAEMYMKTNLEANIATLIGDMHANGEFAEIIEGEVFNDLQRKADGLGHISVQYFGAVGDGETDNAEAINLAIAHASATGRVIWFPDGEYIVNSDITVGSNVTLKGSRNVVIKRAANGLDKYNIFNIVNAHDVTIEGISIEGDRYAHTGTTGQHGCGVNIGNSQNVTVKGCHISECWGDGVTIGGTEETPSEHIEIVDCVVEINRRNGISFIGGVFNSRVSNCAIVNNGGTAPSLGIDFEPWVAGLFNREITVHGCAFADNANGALTLFEYNKGVRIYDCDFDGGVSVKVNDSYVDVEDAHPANIEIYGNRFTSHCYIYRAVFGSFTIHNNIFDGGKLFIEHSANLSEETAKKAKAKTIHGNVFNGSAIAIDVGNNANLSIIGNVANDCGVFFAGYGLYNSVVKDNVVNGYNVNDNAEYVFRLNGVVKNVAIEHNTVVQTAQGNDVAVMFSIGGGSANGCRFCNNDCLKATYARLVQFGAWNDNIVCGNLGPGTLGAAEGLPAAKVEFVGLIVSFLREGVPVPFVCVHTGTAYEWKPVNYSA